MEFSKVPIGFGMALAQNEKALAVYSSMTHAQKQTILSRAHNAQSEAEMHRIVESIADNKA